MGLENRVAVITGATGGLGRVVARGLADAGANLALISTSGDNLAVLVNDLSLAQGRYLTHAADLTDPRRAPEAAAAVQAKFGRVDILLHLVGGWAGGKTVVQLPAEEMAAMLRQHLWSTLYVAQAFVPQLVANSWGRIVVVSSPLATRPAAKSAVYTVAKEWWCPRPSPPGPRPRARSTPSPRRRKKRCCWPWPRRWPAAG
ncbi:MAG: SDR family oxidoreductase [Chloroflexi bacterium]|nr:SDR family oxidoreductase [Chloroflexota bacterium]